MSLQCSLVVYDVPAGKGIPSPVPTFRRRGVRVNLSCWVVPNHLIPWECLNEIAEQGALWHTVKFDSSEADRIIDLATNALTRELSEAQDSLNEINLRSERRLAADVARATSQNEVADANRAHWARIRQQTYIVRNLLEDLANAANIFGAHVGRILSATRSMAETIRANAYAKAAGFVRAKRVLEKEYPALASALAAGDVPPGIAGDWLQENAKDAAEHELGVRLSNEF